MNPVIVEALKILGSILAGVVVGTYLWRRRPHISLVSVKPSGTSKIVGYTAQLSDELVENLKQFHWGTGLNREYQRIEDLSTLHEIVRVVRIFQAASDTSKDLIDEVIAQLEKQKIDEDELRELLGSLLSDNVLVRSLRGMTQRQELKWEVMPDTVDPEKNLLQMEVEDMGGLVGGVQGRVIIPFTSFASTLGFSDPVERKNMINLGYALAKPTTKRLLENLKSLKQQLVNEISLAVKIEKALENVVLHESRWVVLLEITNLGRSPFVVSKEALLSARCGGRNYPPIALRSRSLEKIPEDQDGNNKPQSEREIAMWGITLPPEESDLSSNTFIGPGKSISVTFVSADPIGSDSSGEELLSFWQKKMPEFKVELRRLPKPRFGGGIRAQWTTL